MFGQAFRLSCLLLVATYAATTRAEADAGAAASPLASKDFPEGTATPSEKCGACHQAIYREFSLGFGSDMKYPGIVYRSSKDELLTMPAGSSVSASAHAAAGVDPFPIHAREAEEEGRACNVCHFPQPFAIPDPDRLEIGKPNPRPGARPSGITCASCHLTPEGKIRGPYEVRAPHAVVADARMQTSSMCAYCHSMGKRIPGKQTQTFLEWREDFNKRGLGRQQCQDCHMPRTIRKVAEDADVPERAVARHLWTGGHSAQRLRSALNLVLVQPEKDRAKVELHVINVGAGHSVPTGSNRRAIYLQVTLLDPGGKAVARREWMFAPWYGERPDDRAFLKEDETRKDRIAASQADSQGPHETSIRAGEERILTWEPKLGSGQYRAEAKLVYDLNRYNDRSFKDDQRELSSFTLPLPVQ